MFRVCREQPPSLKKACTSADNKSPSLKKDLISISSVSFFRLCIPPGRLIDDNKSTASCRPVISTFHLFNPSSLIRPTTTSPISPLKRDFIGFTETSLFTRCTLPATLETNCSPKINVPCPRMNDKSVVNICPGVTMLSSVLFPCSRSNSISIFLSLKKKCSEESHQKGHFHTRG